MPPPGHQHLGWLYGRLSMCRKLVLHLCGRTRRGCVPSGCQRARWQRWTCSLSVALACHGVSWRPARLLVNEYRLFNVVFFPADSWALLLKPRPFLEGVKNVTVSFLSPAARQPGGEKRPKTSDDAVAQTPAVPQEQLRRLKRCKLEHSL